ncbi:MAG TPA: hypothetical protein VFG50_00065, partial [Rhodothermales bacterium]|nr:hypothetical protein [Rhodothermales bacterium]
MVLAFSAIPASAQQPLYGTIYRPPGISYRVLTTPHFEVIFQRGFEQDARELGASLEKTLPGSMRLLGVAGASFRLPVVLNGFNDRSNGYVTPFPFKAEIEATSVRGDFLTPRFPSWLEQVSSHELVHAINAEYRPGFGVGAILRLFSPDLARSLNLSAPPGITEGLAVYRESSLYPDAGRLNLAPFDMQFRAAMLSKHPWSLSQVLEPPFFTWPFDRYYNGGAHLVSYLARRDSLRSIRRANDFYYRLPFFGYGLALWYGTRIPPWTLGRRFRRAARRRETARIDSLGPLTQPHVVRGGEGRAYRRPHWLDSRTLLVYGEGYHLTPGFYRIDAATGRRRLVAAHQITEDYAFSLNHDSTALLYARYVADPFVDIRAVSEAFRIDLNSGEEDRITHQGHVFTPVSLPDGSTWAVRNANSRSCLVRLMPDPSNSPPFQGGAGGGLYLPHAPGASSGLNINQGSVLSLLCIEQGDLKGIYPAPGGDTVAVLLNAAGYQGLFRVVQGAGTPRLEPWLVFDAAAIYDADWSRDGRYLVFTADLGGVPNAYAYDVDRDRILKLTNVPFGALEPALSPDGRTLAFIDYHRERYDLATIAFRPDLAESVPRTLASAGRDLNWTALLNRPLPPDTLVSAFRTYNPLRHLAPRALYPFVQLDDTPSSDTDIGTGIGLDLQGADPLQSWAYELRGYYQEHRLWGAAS